MALVVICMEEVRLVFAMVYINGQKGSKGTGIEVDIFRCNS